MAGSEKYGVIDNEYDNANDINRINKVVWNAVCRINTAMPVMVKATYPNEGYVDVLPLVGYVDADNQVVEQATLFHLPYFRVQGGIAALIIDPIPGDIGIAVFTQRDSTNVVKGTKDTVPPGSYRRYSMSDGWYINSFLNQTPIIFLELKQNQTAILTAHNGITMNVEGGCTINADSGCTINATGGGCKINGNTTINGNLTVTSGHHSTMNGNINVVGGEVDVDGVTMKGHTHTGVHGETSTGHG